MNRIIFYFTIMVTGLCMQIATAQTPQDSTKTAAKGKQDTSDAEYFREQKERRIKSFQTAKEAVEVDEKAILKRQIELINKSFEEGKITADEARVQKEKAAKDAALNIDNKMAILENQLELAQRDQNYNIKPRNAAYIGLGLGNAYDDNGSMIFGVEYNNETAKPKFDKRTYGDVVVAGGISNVISEGESFKDSPYKWMKSGYFEFGFTWRTRLLKESNFWRLAYGLSFQVNNLTAAGNRYFKDENGQTTLEPFPYKLKNQNFTVTNLVLPVFLEFGPSEKKEYPDKFRYETLNSFKVGIGGYAGMRTNVMQSLQYRANNSKNTDRHYQDYNVSNFVYGVGGYVGFGPLSLFIKYDLNPLFKNASADQHIISTALRIDL